MQTITTAQKQDLIAAKKQDRRQLAHEIAILKDKLRTAERRYKATAEDLDMLEALPVVDGPTDEEAPADTGSTVEFFPVTVGSGSAIHKGYTISGRNLTKCGAGENTVMGSRRRASYVSKVAADTAYTCKRCGA